MQEKNNFGQLLGTAMPDWRGRQTPPHQILQGRYCSLEPLNLDIHAPGLFHSLTINNLGETWTYLPYGPFATILEFQDWLGSVVLDPTTQLYAVIHQQTKQALGLLGFLRITPEHGVIEIGHVHFSKLMQKTQLATEAVFLLLKKTFDKLNYRRCEWKCHHLNEDSRRAALRFGFSFEGIFRQHCVFKNHSRDTAWFSILDNEWPNIKNKFEKWLWPGNFDENGKQLLSLSEC